MFKHVHTHTHTHAHTLVSTYIYKETFKNQQFIIKYKYTYMDIILEKRDKLIFFYTFILFHNSTNQNQMNLNVAIKL